MAKEKKKNSSYLQQRARFGTLMLLPALLLATALIVVPVVYVAVLSLNKWNGSIAEPLKFVGFENYIKLPTRIGFKDMMVFTFMFSIAVTIVTVGISLLISFALDRPSYRRHVNRSFLRACWYLPTLLGAVAVGIVWRIMYNYNNGILNTLLTMVNLPKVNWLETYGVTGIAVIVAQVWVQMGMCIIIFLAGLQSVPVELYESATIDGASRFQQRMRITIPMLAPSITINFITTSIASFKSYELPYTISKGLPGYSTHLVTQMIQEYSFGGMDYGSGAALSMLLIVLIVVIQLIQLLILRKREDVY